MNMYKRICLLLVALAVGACSNTQSGARAAMGVKPPPDRQAKGYAALLGHDRELPVLKQPNGSNLGSPVPSGELHGNYAGVAPVKFPDNSHAPKSTFKDPQSILKSLRLPPTPVSVKIVRHGYAQLMNWSQVTTDGLTIPYISPNRQVYEVQATYNSQFGDEGNIYSSGVMTIITDAATGQVLFGRTTGTRTSTNVPKTLAPACTPMDDAGYCALDEGTTKSGTVQCIVNHNIINYPSKIAVTYGVYDDNGKLEAATQTSSYNSGPPCPHLISQTWSPNDPKSKYNDPNLP